MKHYNYVTVLKNIDQLEAETPYLFFKGNELHFIGLCEYATAAFQNVRLVEIFPVSRFFGAFQPGHLLKFKFVLEHFRAVEIEDLEEVKENVKKKNKKSKS